MNDFTKLNSIDEERGNLDRVADQKTEEKLELGDIQDFNGFYVALKQLKEKKDTAPFNYQLHEPVRRMMEGRGTLDDLIRIIEEYM